jgi:ABC-type antimicrobial peptide transport system permease subunit
MKHNPPKRALKFLRWFCREDCIEEIEGDLTEIFEKQYKQSPGKAKRKFIWSVVKHLRPEFIKSFKPSYHTNNLSMIRHNLLITYRNFLRYKSSFFINLIGLSSGLTCTLLIYLWVLDELSMDKFHEKDSQLFQVFQNLNTGNGIETIEYTPGPLAMALAEEIPEVELTVSVVPSYWFPTRGIIASDDIRFKVSPQYVSRDFFNVFTYPLVEGNRKEVLADKHAILLSESLCTRLFHTTANVIGKTVQWSHLEGISGEYFVTGVFKDVSSNSTARFDVLFNYDLFLEKRPNLQYWGNSDPCTYVLLKRGTDLDAFNAKIEGLKRQKTQNPEEGTLVALPYSSKYLYGHYQLERGGYGGGRIQYVRLFSIIAVFILAIACINFMNLSTARASRRLKEIGIKKAVGAGRRTLVYQHLSEAMLMAFLSLLVSIAVVYMLLPGFNLITAKHLSLNFDKTLLLSLASIVAFTGLAAGSYPALYLSGFNPVAVLKGKLATSAGEVWMRRGLVIFQFALSIILIASVLVVYKQIQFIQSKNLGYNRDNIISFEMEWKGEGSLLPFLAETSRIPGVISNSCYYHNLLGDHGGTSDVHWDGKDPNLNVHYANLEVGFDFIETLGIEMAEGETFSRDISPERQIIFNEDAIEKMGIEDPVGKTVRLWGEEKQIVGVARNFNFESLYKDIKPCFFQVIPELPSAILKIKGGTEQTTLEQLEKLYQKFSPGLPFEYRFLDADYQAIYAAEQRVGVLSRYFAAVAILISSLGLFGLAAFTAERRVKEIGIRKILGATNFGIVSLLSGDFTKMVLIAIGVALPISYMIGLKWLEDFAYRINLEWWFFISAGAAALLIAWLTVSLQTIKAASTNPSECLRNE